MTPEARDTLKFFALLFVAGALTFVLTLLVGGAL